MSLKPPVRLTPPSATNKPVLSAPSKPGTLKAPTRPIAVPSLPAQPIKAKPTTALVPAAKPSALTTYQAPNKDLLRKKQADIKKERAEAKTRQGKMQLKEGKNTIRILPGSTDNPFHEVYVHYLRNPADPTKNGRPVVCPLKTRNRPCIVCQKVAMMHRTTNAIDREMAKEMKAGRRLLMNVIDINNKEAGVQILEVGVMVYEDLLLHLCGDADNSEEFPGVDYTDPENGFNIIIEKEIGDPNNAKFTTRYKTKVATKSSEVPVQGWATKRFDLEKVYEAMDDDRVRAILEGEEEAAEHDVADATATVADDLDE